jgi:hypothetical protein
MTRQDVESVLNQLPASFSPDELIERLLLLKAIDQSFEELREGKGIPHEQVMADAKKWLQSPR